MAGLETVVSCCANAAGTSVKGERRGMTAIFLMGSCPAFSAAFCWISDSISEAACLTAASGK